MANRICDNLTASGAISHQIRQSDLQRRTIDPAANQVGGLDPEHTDERADPREGTRQGTMTWYNIRKSLNDRYDGGVFELL